MRLVHRQQVTKPTAIFLAFLLPAQRYPTGRACLRRFFYAGIRFVICRPPFDSARFAAEPPLFSRAPFCLKLLPAIGADCFCPFSCLPPFHDLTSMIFDPALVTAKPPSPPPLSALLHDISTAWADIYWHIIMPLGVVIFVPACVTAKFLPCDMTCWFKRLPAVQALQDSLFFTHDLSAPYLFTLILPQGGRSSAILRLLLHLHLGWCSIFPSETAETLAAARVSGVASFSAFSATLVGPSGEIRTPGILLPKQARYQLRYTRL